MMQNDAKEIKHIQTSIFMWSCFRHKHGPCWAGKDTRRNACCIISSALNQPVHCLSHQGCNRRALRKRTTWSEMLMRTLSQVKGKTKIQYSNCCRILSALEAKSKGWRWTSRPAAAAIAQFQNRVRPAPFHIAPSRSWVSGHGKPGLFDTCWAI